jgi:hypothetical protein
MQAAIQAEITGALEQLSRASDLLSAQDDPSSTAQLDNLLEDIIRQQNEIAEKHAAWADATGASRSMNLDTTGALTAQLTQRCASDPCVEHVHGLPQRCAVQKYTS